ncbi:type III polyketide synthase [Emticicia sp. BO119]|uniref:type III polyketide synthase n=1 Tax=Emticicia sp. BO119 TaxID=2757768 RepID=UPI0015F0E5C2|nr:type III polyketide synthase [Emticicia sp. BO119]MBA4849258.1 type III polyketide synthase [Emticicia sp. BO119]
MPKIVSIGTAVPRYAHKQDDIMRFMLDATYPDEKNRKLLPILYKRSGIETRYSVFSDFSLLRGNWHFFGNNCTAPSLEQRMKLFNEEVVALSEKSIIDCLGQRNLQEITHLITVTCTGLSAPGLDILLTEKLNLPTHITRTSVNFMGCYAALHALKIANAFCKADTAAKVLIVCTELCTLHFQKSGDIDSILSSTLFADGSAACLVVGDEKEKGLSIQQFFSKIALAGQPDMAWQLSGNGFLMTLTNHVPKLIKDEIGSLLANALTQLNLSIKDISNWAIHPGGKNILEAVESSLSLCSADLETSYKVLRNYGNMSSATILFVLKQMIDNPTTKGNIFTVAFGPGITIETAMLTL